MAFDFGLMDKFPENVGVGGPGCPDYGKGKGLVMGYLRWQYHHRRCGTMRKAMR